ncbi:MAG: TMEM43 family protein, partial [Deltaproteobacteria bacterium]|nr:TMEM43 family protein [Deltaproteobacteria bacterium]
MTETTATPAKKPLSSFGGCILKLFLVQFFILGPFLLGLSLYLGYEVETVYMEEWYAFQDALTQVGAVQGAPPSGDAEWVMVSGEIAAGKPLVDPLFPVRAQALRLKRHTERYEMVQSPSSGSSSSSNTKQRRIRSSRHRSNSSNRSKFAYDWKALPKNLPESNPIRILAESDLTTANARLGTEALNADLVRMLPGMMPLSLEAKDLPEFLGKLPKDLRDKAKIHEGNLYFGANPGKPSSGDLRVKFSKLEAGSFTLIATRKNGMLMPHAFEFPSGWKAPELDEPGIAFAVQGIRTLKELEAEVTSGLGWEYWSAILGMSALAMLSAVLLSVPFFAMRPSKLRFLRFITVGPLVGLILQLLTLSITRFVGGVGGMVYLIAVAL